MRDTSMVIGKASRLWGLRFVFLAAALGVFATTAQGAPAGGNVISGAGSISQSGETTTITQASSNLSLNWNSFDIAPKETVNFVQPSSSAIAVNRIFDTNGTQILGRLNANGQVYLINPNGILFGQGAQVNVGGLVASTLDLDDASLNENNRSFSGNGAGSVINHGEINAHGGGSVALIGNHVGNQGVITAQLGTVALGAGSKATLSFNGNKLLHMQVDESVMNSLAENGGLIRADGGNVIMTAGASKSLMASVVNNTGVIQAQTVEDHNGTITLLGGMSAGTVNLGGTLDASAPVAGNGGFVETSAAHVKIADSARVTTAAAAGKYGEWLIDPQDYTVAASGGNISGAALSANLGTTPVTLLSSAGATAGAGNVNINDAVTWSANTVLTLTASNNVNINSNITATGNTAGLVINPNTANGAESASGAGVFNLNNNAVVTLSGTNPSLSIAGNSYTVINNLGVAGDATILPATLSLQGLASANLSGYYALGSNINAGATSAWNLGAGFTPIGSVAVPFNGVFDGLGHNISGLTINQIAGADIGMFGSTGTLSVIRNTGLIGGSVIASSSAGGLVGSNTGTISNSYNTGTVSGGSSMGGLMGSNTGAVSNSYATGNVSGTSSLGGLMGSSTGPVSGSFATGNISGTSSLGGLMGSSTGAVSNSYATGNVSGTSSVGGLMGSSTGTILNSYSIGAVNGTTSVGGLMGSSTNTVTNSYWNTQTSGQPTSPAGAGLTSAQMLQAINFSGWDFATTWIIYDNLTNPLLRSFMTPLTITAANVNKTYDGLAFSGGNGLTYSTPPDANLLGTPGYGGNSQGAINAGSYTITPSGLYSNQFGYVITFNNGILTVNGAPLTITANNTSKTYGATTTFAGTEFTDSGLLGSDDVSGVTLTSGGAAAGANVAGSPYAIIASAATGSGLSNYVITYVNGALVLNTAPLTITANNTSKVYGTTKTFAGTEFTQSGLLNSDTVTGVTLTSAGAVATANVAGSPYSIAPSVATGAGLTNYTISYVNGALTATTAPLSVTANAQSRQYGSANPALTYTSSGLVNSDTISGALATIASGTSNIGTYAITQGTLAASSNYTLTYNGANLTVTAAPLTITANNAIKTYGSTLNFNGSEFTDSGLLNSDNITGVTLTSAGSAATASVAGSPYSIAPSAATGTGLTNYIITYNNGILTINPAPLAVTGVLADDKIYDGTSTAFLSGNAAISPFGSDDVSLGGVGSGLFANPNVGTNKAVSVSGFSLSGADAGNYAIVQPANLMADIFAPTLPPSLQPIPSAVQSELNLLLAEGVCRAGPTPNSNNPSCRPPRKAGFMPFVEIVNGGVKMPDVARIYE